MGFLETPRVPWWTARIVKFWAQGKEARGTSQTGLGNILHEGALGCVFRKIKGWDCMLFKVHAVSQMLSYFQRGLCKMHPVLIVFRGFLFNFLKSTVSGIPWPSGGWDSELPLQGARVPSVVGELRSRKLCGAAKKKNRNIKMRNEIYRILGFQVENGRLNTSIYLHGIHKTPLNDSKGIKIKLINSY